MLMKGISFGNKVKVFPYFHNISCMYSVLLSHCLVESVVNWCPLFSIFLCISTSEGKGSADFSVLLFIYNVRCPQVTRDFSVMGRRLLIRVKLCSLSLSLYFVSW